MIKLTQAIQTLYAHWSDPIDFVADQTNIRTNERIASWVDFVFGKSKIAKYNHKKNIIWKEAIKMESFFIKRNCGI